MIISRCQRDWCGCCTQLESSTAQAPSPPPSPDPRRLCDQGLKHDQPDLTRRRTRPCTRRRAILGGCGQDTPPPAVGERAILGRITDVSRTVGLTEIGAKI